MSTAVPIIRGDGEGERRWFAGGGVWTMKATAEETDGAFMLFEDRMPRGKTTPLHTHPHEDETFIVLEGEILMHVEGTDHLVGPGGVAVVPRGARHAFLVTSEVARILALQTPGSGEAFCRDASEPSTDENDAERPPDWDRLRAAAERNPGCIEILGPPPFEGRRNSPRELKPRARRRLTVYQAGEEEPTPEPGGTSWRGRNWSMTKCGSW